MQGWIMIALLGGALLVGSPAAHAQRDDPDDLKKQVELRFRLVTQNP